MEQLETLKRELINQKDRITELGGRVDVANLNPTPTEITTALNNMQVFDLTEANATASDVMAGKTFYSGDMNLKTGTLEITLGEGDSFYMDEYLLSNASDPLSLDRKTYRAKPGVTKLREYLFGYNKNPFHFVFSSDIKTIGAYAFYSASNATFENFEAMTQLQYIDNYAFYKTDVSQAIDFTDLPDSLTTIGQYAFSEATIGQDIVIKSTVNTLYNYCFGSENTFVNKHTLTMQDNCCKYGIAQGAFMRMCFNCDFTIPLGVTSLPTKFNHIGGFNNITIGSHVTKLGDYCFGSLSYLTDGYANLQSITCERETPPTFGYECFPEKITKQNAKIYVPDQSLDAYKSKQYISKYASYMYPMSQKV